MLLIPTLHVAETSFFKRIDSAAKRKTHVFMENHDEDAVGPFASLFKEDNLTKYYRSMALHLSNLRTTFLNTNTQPIGYSFDHYQPKSNWVPIKSFTYEERHEAEIQQLEKIGSQQSNNLADIKLKAAALYLYLVNNNQETEILPLIRESLEKCLFGTLEKVPIKTIQDGLISFGGEHIPNIAHYLFSQDYELDKIQSEPIILINYPTGFIPWLESQLATPHQY